MWILKLAAFSILAMALGFSLPYLPPMRRALQSVACEAGETFEMRTIENANESSAGWHCVDAQGRFHMSETSVHEGELAAAGISMGAGCLLAALPFGVMWLVKRRQRNA